MASDPAPRDPAPRKTEADIQTEIVNALCRQQVGVTRINGLAAKTVGGAVVHSYLLYPNQMTVGHSDLIACKRGRAIYLEVKRPGGTPDEAQRRFKAWCEWYAMPYIVVTSADEALQACYDHAILNDYERQHPMPPPLHERQSI